MMQAAYIEQTGGPEVIQVGPLPKPQVTGAQVLVEVGAVSVNPIDTYLRSGAIAMDLPSPYIIGCDLAGTVVETGPAATRFKPGERVWGSNQGLMGRQGTFAQFAAVEEEWLYPLPEGVEFEKAAAIALVGITAHLGLFEKAALQPGETVFVSGGTGGVGSAVVQMAAAAGARVTTTAGSAQKAEMCRALGAVHVVQYKQEDLAQAVAAMAPQGVDVWFETLREPNFERTIALLKKGGRMVVMAGRQALPPFPVGPFYVKDCTLLGFAMFNATAQVQQTCGRDINRWMSQGKLKALVDRVLPLEQAALAHQLQEANTLHAAGLLAGKIVLRP